MWGLDKKPKKIIIWGDFQCSSQYETARLNLSLAKNMEYK